MPPPYTLIPVNNESGQSPSLQFSSSLRKRGLTGLVAAVALDEAYAAIEAAGVQGFKETQNNDSIYFEMVGGRYCIAHTPNPNNPDEILVLNTFKLADFPTGRDEAWRLWKTVAVPIP